MNSVWSSKRTIACSGLVGTDMMGDALAATSSVSPVGVEGIEATGAGGVFRAGEASPYVCLGVRLDKAGGMWMEWGSELQAAWDEWLTRLDPRLLLGAVCVSRPLLDRGSCAHQPCSPTDHAVRSHQAP